MARQKKYKSVAEYKHIWYLQNREKILAKLADKDEQIRKENTKKKKCPICKKSFYTHIDRQRFCSTVCSDEGDRIRSLEFDKSHKKEKSLYDKEYRKANLSRKKHLGRVGHLRRTFGLTPEDYDNMFDSQQGKCAICGKHQSELKKFLHIDHDHKTGIIRGLLCRKCNQGLGLFEDNIVSLENAIKYLKEKE